ncbi:MAG: DNA polymerase/3'-5' exonuclease PolX [Verrucomicrobiales bacterium]
MMVETLERIALLLELKGENPFKVRAYRQGAEAVAAHAGEIVGLAAAGQLDGIPGLGEALREKLHELATTGKLAFFDELRAEFPKTIFDLFEIPGLGPKKIAVLHRDLGVGNLAELKAACESGAVAELPGFGEKTAKKILEGLAYREQNAGVFRMDEAAPGAAQVLAWIKAQWSVSRAEVGGSFRRGKEVVRDLDFVVATKHGEELLESLVGQPFVATVLAQGPTKASFRLANGCQCDVRAVKDAEYATALAYFTGNKEHNVAMRARALKRGWSLNEYRLQGCPTPLHEEADLYRALGLDYVPPELREDRGELEAAEKGTLPKLVEHGQLKGTFHNHTTASDGTATLEEMAAAARDLGLLYLGIADHSKSSFQASGLDEKRLRAQVATIARMNDRFAEEAETEGTFRLFAGSEVDILKDGSLDFADEVLAQLDYAVASVHNAFSLPEAEMTRRIIRAVENPHITMLGHLTGRLLLRREPYAVDVPAVIDACAATGTLIELNANPWRLDMDWRWWPLAKEKGVKTSINPDAHSTADLAFLWHGVRIARKGWLTKADVINTLPLGKIEAALAAKRQRGHS